MKRTNNGKPAQRRRIGIVLLWIWGVLVLCWIALCLFDDIGFDRMGWGLAMSLLGMAAALAMIRRARRDAERQ